MKQSALQSLCFLKKRRSAKIIFIVLMLILIVSFTHQYFLFKTESNEMLYYLARKQIQLIEINKYGEKAEQEIEEIHRKLSNIRVLIPATLDVKSFMEDFKQWAKGSGVIVADFGWHEEEREFYKMAHCGVKLFGDKQAIRNLWGRKGEIERFVKWGKEKPLDTGVEVKLILYSTPRLKEIEFDSNTFKQHPCKEFTSKVRLWLFSRRIREVQKQLEHICLKIGEHAEEVRKIALIKNRKQEIAYLSELIRHLKKANNGS